MKKALWAGPLRITKPWPKGKSSWGERTTFSSLGPQEAFHAWGSSNQACVASEKKMEGFGCKRARGSGKVRWLDRACRVTGRKGNLTECIAQLTFSPLSLSLLCFPLLFYPALCSFPSPFLCPSPCFHSQEDKNQLFHCLSRLRGSAGFGAGDALWCH